MDRSCVQGTGVQPVQDHNAATSTVFPQIGGTHAENLTSGFGPEPPKPQAARGRQRLGFF